MKVSSVVVTGLGTCCIWTGVAIARLTAVVDYEPLIRKAENVAVVKTGKVDSKAFTAELTVIRTLKGDVTGVIVLSWSGLGLRGRSETTAYPQEGSIAIAALARTNETFQLVDGRFLANGLASTDDVQVAVFDTYCQLVKLGEATTPGMDVTRLKFLGAQTKDARWQYRWGALDVAAEKVPVVARGEFAPLVLQALKDTEPKVVAKAVRICAMSEWRITEAVDPILAILNAEKRADAEVLETALRRIGGLDSARAYDTLLRFAGDRSAEVREAAVFGLMFGCNKTKIDPLLRAMRDSDGRVRGRACEALENVPDKRAVPALIEALADPEGAVRQPAIRVLESWTGQRLDYNPHDPLHLGPAVAKWREWWTKNQGTIQLSVLKEQVSFAGRDSVSVDRDAVTDGLKVAYLVGSGVILAVTTTAVVAEKAIESQREGAETGAKAANATTASNEKDLTFVNGCRFEAVPTSTVCLVRHDLPEVTWLDLNLRITRNADTNAVRLHPYFGVRIVAPDGKVSESYQEREWAKPPRAMTEEDYYDLNPGNALDITLENRRGMNLRRAMEPRSVLHVWKDRDVVRLQWARVVNWFTRLPADIWGSHQLTFVYDVQPDSKYPNLWTGHAETKPANLYFAREITPPQTNQANIVQFDPVAVVATLGAESYFVVRSRARWEMLEKEIRSLDKTGKWNPDKTVLDRLDFSHDMLVCCAMTGTYGRVWTEYLHSNVSGELVARFAGSTGTDGNSNWFFVAVVAPKVETIAVDRVFERTGVPSGIGPARHFNAAGGDFCDGLQAVLKPKRMVIAPGEDIELTFVLKVASDAKKSVYVWDNKYSEGYRNDAYLVELPDGTTKLLRLSASRSWAKNIPSPVELKPGETWELGNWTKKEPFLKSLKALGLDTSRPGRYTITGVYMEQAASHRGRTVPGDKEFEIPMWGGNIATPPVVVEVK